MAVDAVDLRALGWDERWSAAYAEVTLDGRRPARVVTSQRDLWLVAGLTGSSEPIAATLAGRLRFEATGPADLPAVGDWVAVSLSEDAQRAVIHAVVPRRSVLGRSSGDGSRRGGGRTAGEQVLAANVNLVAIVAGLDRDFNLRRIERYLAVAWSSGATPLVVLSKADVDDDLAGHRLAAEAVAPGVDVLAVSARTGAGLDALQERLRPGMTAVVVGSSGVGKSTLVNALLGRERQQTQTVREDDARGRHTTTSRELIPLSSGALLIDTPGLRALEIAGAEDGMDNAFADVAELATRCRFGDCRHRDEPGCAVRSAVEAGTLPADRFEAFRKLERELAFEVRKTDPRAAAGERRRWKLIHSSVQRQMRERYGGDWR
jgi:ribosome biogenesis GTPase / thiamine phosphate phosphatase